MRRGLPWARTPSCRGRSETQGPSNNPVHRPSQHGTRPALGPGKVSGHVADIITGRMTDISGLDRLLSTPEGTEEIGASHQTNELDFSINTKQPCFTTKQPGSAMQTDAASSQDARTREKLMRQVSPACGGTRADVLSARSPRGRATSTVQNLDHACSRCNKGKDPCRQDGITQAAVGRRQPKPQNSFGSCQGPWNSNIRPWEPHPVGSPWFSPRCLACAERASRLPPSVRLGPRPKALASSGTGAGAGSRPGA